MENLPVVTNASFQPWCVLIAQMILKKQKITKCHFERMIEVGVCEGKLMQKRLNLQRGFLQTQFSKDWLYPQEHVIFGFNSSCYDIHWRKRTC